MSEPLDRDDVIELLNRLGSEQDEEVLEAARQVHARVAAAGVTWETLLVPEEAEQDDAPEEDVEDVEAEEEDDDHSEADAEDADEDEAPVTPAEKKERNAEALALIEKLLARPDSSEEFREELEDYKSDIENDEFAAADHRYILALHKRLSKGR